MDNLIKRLRECEYDYSFGLLMGKAANALEAQAERIAELEAEAEKWLQRASDNGHRAEKAEADLAAALAALDEIAGNTQFTGDSSEVIAQRCLAAARGVQASGDKCAVCGADPCECKKEVG